MNAIQKYLAEIGAKGGAAGTGKAKARGGSAYYEALAKKASAARKRSHKAREKAAKG